MNDILNKPIVLQLNANWEVVGHKTVQQSLVDLVGGINSMAIDIQYETNDDGSPNFSNPINFNPLTWEDWIELPIRDWDMVVNSQKFRVRVPTVIVAKNFRSMPKKRYDKHENPSLDSIWKRDGGIDQYTGETLDRKDATMDHIIPVSRKGNNSWGNKVLTHRKINSMKGNKLNHEIGLRLIREPVIPKPTPLCEVYGTDVKHPDWKHFIKNR